jgi:hypothetical protein
VRTLQLIAPHLAEAVGGAVAAAEPDAAPSPGSDPRLQGRPHGLARRRQPLNASGIALARADYYNPRFMLPDSRAAGDLRQWSFCDVMSGM